MADGHYDSGVTEPGWPALSLDDPEAVVFDTDDVLTDTASVHAAAWKRLFDEYLRRRAACGSELFRPFTEADYLPEELDGLGFDVRYRGHWGVSLRFSPELVRVKVADAAGVPIRVGVNGEVVALAPGGMREFPS